MSEGNTPAFQLRKNKFEISSCKNGDFERSFKGRVTIREPERGHHSSTEIVSISCLQLELAAEPGRMKQVRHTKVSCSGNDHLY